MEHCRGAERALVAALVMGEVDPAELAGRLHPLDFTDPGAGACFAAALERGRCGGAITDLPELLRGRGELRSDGYPITELVGWLPSLPVPPHPQAWATLVVAGSLGRVVQACGTRLLQAADPTAGRPEAGRVLTMAAAQRATLHGALRRWDALPVSWRDTVPARPVPPAVTARAAGSTGGSSEGLGRVMECEVLAGLVAAPALLDRLGWLRAEDFTEPGAAEVFGTLRRLHADGRPVDLVTLAAAVSSGAASSAAGRSTEGTAAAVCAGLRPDQAVPATVGFLARRLLEDATVRHAREVGEDLVALAGAPGSAGGLGRPLLDASLRRLDALRPDAERLEQALRPGASRAGELARAVSRLSERRAVSVTNRHAG